MSQRFHDVGIDPEFFGDLTKRTVRGRPVHSATVLKRLQAGAASERIWSMCLSSGAARRGRGPGKGSFQDVGKFAHLLRGER